MHKPSGRITRTSSDRKCSADDTRSITSMALTTSNCSDAMARRHMSETSTREASKG